LQKRNISKFRHAISNVCVLYTVKCSFFLISVWFIPVTGFMCAACHVFVEEKNQKTHCKEITHSTNVIKFKRQVP